MSLGRERGWAGHLLVPGLPGVVGRHLISQYLVKLPNFSSADKLGNSSFYSFQERKAIDLLVMKFQLDEKDGATFIG